MNLLGRLKHKTRIRTRLRDAKKKAKSVVYVYRTDGYVGLSNLAKNFIKKRYKNSNAISTSGDVLIISINDSLLDRYRADHMVEALRSAGVNVAKVYDFDLKKDHIKNHNVFIFYRSPYLPGYEKLIKDIKSKNKIAIYAVDDLVVDTKYTSELPAVKELIPEDREIYDDGVIRHGKLMRKCDYAITTTKALRDELKKYDNFKDVYIDRNTMSDEMVHFSNLAFESVERSQDKVVIGYFSGTNTHNEDFRMVAPALLRILEKYDDVYIKLTGRIDPPEELKDYADRLIYTPFVDWRRLPYELRQCHITLSPLVNTLFNRAKSEIKWTESALVGVPVVASNIGAFKEVVKNGETGILVENNEDAWFGAISSLIEDRKLRENIGQSAKDYVLENCRTTGSSAVKLKEFIESITPPVIAFGGINISAPSGGNLVVKKHMDLLREAGNIVYGVESMAYKDGDKWQKLNREDDKTYDIFRVNSHRKTDKVQMGMSFDRFVATFWASVDMVDRYHCMKSGGRKLYLVQGREDGFYDTKDKTRQEVLATYRNHRLEPITISKWCQSWLKSDFGRDAEYAPNGIDIEKFTYKKRDWSNRKIKVLIEGDSASEFKRVDESFEIANRLDRSKYEVSYLSNGSGPKDWYKTDNVYIKIPIEKVGNVYEQHDILLKSSVLESFSYPPLEIMATGGVPVIVKNGGNSEYVKDGENALYYLEGDVDDALRKIEDLVSDERKFEDLAKNGYQTAVSRDLQTVKKDILRLYE